MKMTSEMRAQIATENETARDFAEEIMKSARELRVSPDYLLSKISRQLGELAKTEEVNS